MITVKESTKRGQNLIARGLNYEGVRLEDVYSSYSSAKYRAWLYWFDKFNNSKEPVYAFGICSHTTYGFSLSWFSDYGMHVVTSQNHYFIPLAQNYIELCLSSR